MGQAKELITPSALKTKQLLRLDRSNLRTVTGLLTGHCHLRRHQSLMGVAEDPECRGCLEDEETLGQVLMSCTAFS